MEIHSSLLPTMDDFSSPKRSKVSVIFEWFKAILKMKYRDISYVLSIVIAIGITWISCIDFMTEEYLIDKHISDKFEELTIKNLSKICESHCLFISPDTIQVKNYVNDSLPYCKCVEYFKIFEDFYHLNPNNSTVSSSFCIDIKIDGKKRRARIIYDYNYKLNSIQNIITASKNMSVSFNVKSSDFSYPYLNINYMSYSCTLGFIFPILICLIFSYLQVSSWLKSGAIRMVNVAGIKQYEIWISILVADFIPVFLSALMMSVELKVLSRVTYGCALAISLLGFVALYSSAALVIALFTNRWRILTALVLWATASAFLSFYPTISWQSDSTTAMRYYPIVVHLSPAAVVREFIFNIKQTGIYHPKSEFTFFGAPSYQHFRNEGLLAIALVQTAAFALAFALIAAMRSGEVGAAAIGWRNAFSLRRWRRLFSRKLALTYLNNTVELDGVWKMYRRGKVEALRGVDLRVGEGEKVVVIGANGAGKSSLLNVISGSVDADRGTLKFSGVESSGLSQMDCSVGFCFQDNVFFDKLSVYEHVWLFGCIRGLPDGDCGEAVGYVSESLGLGRVLDQRCDKLSGGEKRKVSVAMAIIGWPEYAVMDEPTAGVDASSRKLIWKFIADQASTTSIISSHTIEEAEDFCTRVVLLSSGEKIFEGTCEEMRERFNCGYRIRLVDERGPSGDDQSYISDEDAGAILSRIQSISPRAVVDAELGDCIMVPIDDRVPLVMGLMDDVRREQGIGCTITVESLENVLLRIIFAEEVSAAG